MKLAVSLMVALAALGQVAYAQPPLWGRVSAGVEMSCIVARNNTGYCMGNNRKGQLGSGDFTNSVVPHPIKTNLTWTQVIAGDWHSCGLATTGDAYCWGYNADGRCGSPPPKDLIYLTPTIVSGGYKWKQISPGYFYTCGLRTDGAIMCFGKNNHGRIGNGQFKGNVTKPVQVGTDKDWIEVFAGGDITCARKKDMTVWCWGNNEEGQLGVGKTYAQLQYSAVPIKLAGKWKQLSTNSKFSCAIAMDDTAHCWGSNAADQLGINKRGGYRISPTPVYIPAGQNKKWLQTSAGQFVACGIKSDNSVWCWGKLGIRSPQRMSTGKGWTYVSAGDWSGMGLYTSKKGYSWWENEWGEGGVGYASESLEKPTEIVGGAVYGPSAKA